MTLDKPQIYHNRITIPSIPALIKDVDDFLEAKLRERKVPDSLIADIAISATELVNNGIYHGNKQDQSKTVTLELEFIDTTVKITISDEGASGFDPGGIADPTEERNLLREAGRGIFIVRELMDSVEIKRGAQGGTIVTIVKKFSQAS